MLKSHDKFHSSNGKRLILIVDDEEINREILAGILQDDYEIILATNGQEALELMRKHNETLSLVLLDLIMPEMSGLEMLGRAKAEPEISDIPVIVITADREAEIESLTLGAIDFIPKPYPQPGVVKARILRTIELSEDRKIILSTERDALTGLYNREYFYEYVEQFDNHHKNAKMDAIVVDVNHFRMINERFGTSFGDDMLRRVGAELRTMMVGIGGFVCRKEADTFIIYCPHGQDYAAMLDRASDVLVNEDADEARVWLRMGVYANADKSLEVERRFDRAKMAADSVQGSFTNRIGVYDDSLHQKELFEERLVDDFQQAIKEHQFKVYFQPKFDIEPEPPVLASAEALVRWKHPELGMIPPNEFIPLFEENGLVQALDMFVWRETAALASGWKSKYGFSIPVSVNVSRIDMYDPRLVETISGIIDEFGLDASDLQLEITESAYTENFQQVIKTVEDLRALGLSVEMDDFGTGYSSLNMISTLPIDAMKLDMQFIRSAFEEGGDTRILEIIIDIAEYLSVPVIAEGVEAEDQLIALREMGCDYVQGYYFSPPVPAEEYEKFLIERAKTVGEIPITNDRISGIRRMEGGYISGRERRNSMLYASVVRALATEYFGIYYVDTTNDRFIGYGSRDRHNELDIKRKGEDFFNLVRESMRRAVHPDDEKAFLSSFTKENMLDELSRDKPFVMTFRLMVGGEPTYVHMKAARMEDKDDNHIVVGISNVDDQVRKEQERDQALQIANRDALTGVKSMHAYSEDERAINQAIQEGVQEPFALAVCDVNDLKLVNDTLGHNAGDEHIKAACRVVCTVFKHSPVFRVGGDEFVAILRGSDYRERYDLMAQLQANNQQGIEEGNVLIAGGMGSYRPGEDKTMAAVFERADAAMYANKKALKEA